MIRIGYAGINTKLDSPSRTFRLRNYSEAKMLETAKANISALEQILFWNIRHDITLFRITSNLIPYGSSKINSGSWKEVFSRDLSRIGSLIKKNGIRTSMHPGQYTVLNSPIENTFLNSLADLEYHTDIFELLGLDEGHKIDLHIGGSYGNKTQSIDLFAKRFLLLPEKIKNRLSLENDDRLFNANDVLDLARKLKICATLDVLHHQILPNKPQENIVAMIKEFSQTWQHQRQAIHYSNQEFSRRRGGHSLTIDLMEFSTFYNQVKDLELDIMLEVKDKQESVLKIRKTFPEIK